MATYASTLIEKELDSDEVVIGDTKYRTDLGIERYLGYNVEFYCTIPKGSEDSEIIAFFPDVDTEKLIKINLDDISAVRVGTELGISIDYFVEGKNGSKEKTVSSSAPIIVYNGKAESFEDAAAAQAFLDANMNQGDITYLPKTVNNYKDILFVENYDAYVVASADEKNMKIAYNIYEVGKTDTGVIDLSDTDNPDRKVFVYGEDGAPITIADLAKNDVIMVYASADTELYRIYQSKKQVVGAPKSRKLISKAEEVTKEPVPQPDWQDLKIIDFASYTTTTAASSTGGTPYEGTATSSNNTTYNVAVPKGDWHRVGQFNQFVSRDSVSTIAGTATIGGENVFQLDRKRVGSWSGAQYPPNSAGFNISGDFGEIASGDNIRVTACLGTQDVKVYNGTKVAPTEIPEQSTATSVISINLYDEKGR